MKHTKQEIALAKKLYELGVKKEIKYGDWYIIKNHICLMASKHEPEMSSVCIPLWTWADARGWLREKCYWLLKHFDHADNLNKNTVRIINAKTIHDLIHKRFIEQSGNSDLEAILKCMVSVVSKSLKVDKHSGDVNAKKGRKG